MGQIGVGVELVRQGHRGGVGQATVHELRRRLSAQQALTKRSKRVFALTGNHMVRLRKQGLIVPFVADFRAAEHDDQVGSERLEQQHDGQRFGGVPDVDAEADDARLCSDNGERDVERPLADGELGDGAERLELA